MAVGIGARQPRGDLGAIDRLRHHAESVVERREIEPREVKDLHDLRIGQQRLQVRRIGVALRNLDDIGAAVAVRHLHHAEPVAMRVQPHGLSIDRHRILVAGQIGQIAAMQADSHEGSLVSRVDSTETLAPKTSIGERLAAQRGRECRLFLVVLTRYPVKTPVRCRAGRSCPADFPREKSRPYSRGFLIQPTELRPSALRAHAHQFAPGPIADQRPVFIGALTGA